MPTRERLAVLGTARGRKLISEFADELRRARLAAGVSQASVAHAVGLSQQMISCFERGVVPYPDFFQAARVARIVGLELSVRCYPAPGQLRDAAHVALIRRFVARLGRGVTYRLEAPIQPGDQRAWDVLVSAGGTSIGVIAETRIRDLQALLRREHQKQLDGGVGLLLLLAADTRHNRSALTQASTVLLTSFPLQTRAVLTPLGRSEAPTANGVAVL
ncbi:MAG TPA: helix-turn-helix transcriptional regulator [Candidatus Limnocylindria bacterium]|nr:helix-turn-helix transcriptional regulator [Candidatus Limnocylindria bacterium]